MANKHNTSLTDKQAREIAIQTANGVDQKTLARRFKVSQGTISNIVTGKTYKNATKREEAPR